MWRQGEQSKSGIQAEKNKTRFFALWLETDMRKCGGMWQSCWMPLRWSRQNVQHQHQFWVRVVFTQSREYKELSLCLLAWQQLLLCCVHLEMTSVYGLCVEHEEGSWNLVLPEDKLHSLDFMRFLSVSFLLFVNVNTGCHGLSEHV